MMEFNPKMYVEFPALLQLHSLALLQIHCRLIVGHGILAHEVLVVNVHMLPDIQLASMHEIFKHDLWVKT